MIDDPDKARALMARMQAALPLTARLSPGLRALMRLKEPGAVLPDKCAVVEIFYMGEEGGISCHLDLGKRASQNPFIVSITNLIFDRRCPVFREIDGYQKHRIKKLKKQQGRGA